MATNEKLVVEVDGDVSGALSGFAKVNAAAAGMGTSVGKADAAIKKTTPNYQNFGRVIQDLPFGFMGIQNNLTQLIPSVGAAGLAFSVFTAAITFAQVGTTYWSKKTKEAKKDTDDFSDSLKSAEASALSTGVRLQNFVEIARNGNLPLKQRNEALKEANKLMGEHGDKLTLTNINTEKARKQVELFTQALVQQALAAKFADRVADLIVKQKDATKEYAKAQQEYLKASKAVTDENASSAQAELGGGQILPLLKAKSDAYNDLVDKTSAYKLITQDLKTVMGELYSSEAQATAIMGELGTKTKDTGGKVDHFRIRMELLNAQLKEQLAMTRALSSEGPRLGANLVNAAPARTPTTAPAAPDVFSAMGGTDAFQTIMQNQAALNGQNQALAMYNDLVGQASAATQVYTGVFSDLSTALLQGQSLGTALGSVFKKLASDILKAVVQAAIFSTILNAISSGAAGALGAAGGKGKGGFLSLFKGFLGFKMPGSANGSIVTKPQVVTVGEGGESEAILPLSRLSSMLDNAASMGGANGAGAGAGSGYVFELRGNALVALINRTNNSLSFTR